MIEKIKIEEDTLYVELDFNYEFSKINVFKDINNILNTKKLKFKGKKIIFTISGVVVATLVLNKPVLKNKTIKTDSYEYVTSLIIDDYDLLNKKELPKIEENKEPKKIEETKEKEIINNVQKEEKVVKQETKKESKKETVKKEETTKKTEKNNSEKTKTEQKKQEEKENSTYVKVYRKNGDVLTLELEEYVIGVVGAEMPASFNEEALKAQSLLARTYALKSVQNNKKLTDTESTQSYKDNNELKSMWGSNYDKYYNKIKKAVDETKGGTITYKGQYIEAVYHSTSNGYTEDASNVWGNSYPYLVSVESPYDKNVSSYQKNVTFTYEEINKKLNINLNIDSIIKYETNTSNRVNHITIDNHKFKGTDFRTKLGLRSTDFKLELKENEVIITTKGYGHGVGMSQYGANEMAKQGSTYKEIIKHYYKDVTIS